MDFRFFRSRYLFSATCVLNSKEKEKEKTVHACLSLHEKKKKVNHIKILGVALHYDYRFYFHLKDIAFVCMYVICMWKWIIYFDFSPS